MSAPPFQRPFIVWISIVTLSLLGFSLVALFVAPTFPAASPTPAAVNDLAHPPPLGQALPQPAGAISAGNARLVGQLARLGHGKAMDVAYAPGGHLLAVATTAGLGLYKAETLALERFIETGSPLTDVDFAPDGASVATGGPARIWRVADGQLLHTLQGNNVAFSPDGLLLASGEKHEVWLWRSRDGQLLRTLTGHTGGVASLAFSPDGSVLAVGSVGLYGEDTVRLWRVSDGQLLGVLEGHTDTIAGLAFSPGGETLASGSYDSTVRLWQVSGCSQPAAECGKLLRTLKGHMGYVSSVAFSPAATGDAAGQYTLVSGADDGQVCLWQVPEGRLLHTFKGGEAKVTGVAFSPDGTRLAAVSRTHWSDGGQGHLRLWELAKRTLLRTQEIHADVISSVAFSPDGKRLAAGGQWDGVIRLWRVADGALLGLVTRDPAADDPSARAANLLFGVSANDLVWDVAFSPDGERLASVSSGYMLLWRVSDGTLLDKTGSLGPVHGLAFDSTTPWLAAGVKNTVVLWEIVQDKLVRRRELKGHASYVQSVAFSADGSLLASSAHDDALVQAKDNTVRVWRVSDGELLRTLPAGDKGWYMESVAFSPDGSLLAASVGSRVWLWRVSDGQLLRELEGHTSTVRSVAFSADGTVLASGAWDNTVRLWRVPDGQLLRTLEGHTDYVTSLAFSPDGRWLASGAYDGTLRLWGAAGK
ncbi:MAG: WD40 repeat domain-containing protein [Thermoflexales bacterium]|nr:WD40 repeat domain-containing protein [Thermoflexales bacterium]